MRDVHVITTRRCRPSRRSRSLQSLRSARRRVRSTRRANASFFFAAAKGTPRRRYRLLEPHSGRRAPPAEACIGRIALSAAREGSRDGRRTPSLGAPRHRRRVLLLVSRDVAEQLGVLTRRRTTIARRFTLSSRRSIEEEVRKTTIGGCARATRTLRERGRRRRGRSTGQW